MRILLLAPIHREKEYLRGNRKSYLPRFQAQSAWVEAFEALDHRVSVFIYTNSVLVPNKIRINVRDFLEKNFPLWASRFSRIKSRLYFFSLENFLRNKKLLSFAHKTRPNLIIISGGISNIYPSTIKRIKDKYNCQVLLFSGINANVASTQIERMMIRHGIVDIVVENDRGYAKRWERLGAKKTIILPISSVDPELHRKIKLKPTEQEEFGCDVCFVGTLTADRQKKLSELTRFNLDGARLRLDLKIWGDIPPGEGLISSLKPFYNGPAFGEKMVKIFNATKLVLNFQPADMTHGGNMRTFEIPGCGAFQLADRIDKDWFEEGKEYVSFKDIKDLKSKIAYYQKNQTERNSIARKGYIKSHKLCTYQEHYRKLFSLIYEKK